MSTGDDAIFLIRDGVLEPMVQTPYEQEAILQKALADYPAVLAGGTTSAGTAELVLVSQEFGVPIGEGAGSTWSLDHLFLDAEGVPVIVEVKRSSDTRIRREVIGQMLDYAANGLRYWPIEKLRSAFAARCAAADIAAHDRVQQLTGNDDEEAFWDAVESNLRAGRVRMVFVADRLPPELVTIIEFLNEQMNPAEVLGVEVPQYVGEHGTQVLVPRVVGRTTSAQHAKGSSSVTQWSEATFLAEADNVCEPGVRALYADLFNQIHSHHGRFAGGRSEGPGGTAWFTIDGSEVPVWSSNLGTSLGSEPYLYFWVGRLKDLVGGDRFATLVEQLASIPTYAKKMSEAAAVDYENKSPVLKLPAAVAEGSQQLLLDALNQFVG